MIRQVLKLAMTLLDNRGDLVYLLIELFLPVRQLASLRLLERGNHPFSDEALIIYQFRCSVRAAWSGIIQAPCVVVPSIDRVGYPGNLPVKRAGDEDKHAGRFMLSRVEFSRPP